MIQMVPHVSNEISVGYHYDWINVYNGLMLGLSVQVGKCYVGSFRKSIKDYSHNNFPTDDVLLDY